MGRMIAVIDDDACVRRAFARLLRVGGYDVCTYESGPEFLDACRLHPPDCAILDLHMPGQSGPEIQRCLRDMGLQMPLILITADAESQACRAALEDGAAALLLKPVDGPTLLACMEEAMARPAGSSRSEKARRRRIALI